MCWIPAIEWGYRGEVGIDAIETLIIPRSRDLGDFEARRAQPAPQRPMVGPFIFFDQAGNSPLAECRMAPPRADWMENAI